MFLYVRTIKKRYLEVNGWMKKEDFDRMEEETVIGYAREGNNDAVDYLMEKYKNLVRQKARRMYLIGGDTEDLIQEGMIGLYKALRDYDSEKNTSFYTFADLCISRQIYSAIKASNRKKNQPLNTYISFYAPAGKKNEETEEDISLVDVMFWNKNANPEKIVVDKEYINVIEYELERRLSRMENEVLKFYIKGYTYVQIAEMLAKSPKSIDNTLQRIKAKVTAILQENS